MTSFVINTREAGLAGVGRARGRVPGGVRSLVGSEVDKEKRAADAQRSAFFEAFLLCLLLYLHKFERSKHFIS